MTAERVLVLRADATASMGTGHVVRCVALAEEAAARGMRPVLLGTCEVPWLSEILAAAPLTVARAPDTAEGLRERLRELAPEAVVIDAYHLPRAHYHAAAAIAPVLAAYDGRPHHARGDVLYDQNIGADRTGPPAADGALLLRGPSFAVVRDDIKGRRPVDPALRVRTRAAAATPPKVLLVLGGTDALGGTLELTKALLSQVPELHLHVVTADAAGVRALPSGPRQRVQVVTPTPELPALMTEMDLVVSAAGTTTIELCCLGVPAALIQVVDNQVPVYEGAVSHGCAEGLGTLAHVVAEPAAMARRIRALLAEPDRRAQLAERAWQTVDGRGRQRILDAVGAVVVGRRNPFTGDSIQ
ncbi:PseG/SpsG family protein [Streptomyces sp. NPDC051555]|uniref:PseG/SpsG family protein n=1 Tax=Streptomyces sp. NPDC051555 TaxID=3365657 RepID=UPI0037B30903